MAPPDFGRLVNPISTRKGEADYACHITIYPLVFSDFPTDLMSDGITFRETSWIDPKILFFDEIKFEMPTSQFINQVDVVP